MQNAELIQLELFAQVDELLRRLRQWGEGESAWEPLNHSRAVVRRLLGRLETLRVRLEAPLVVATFGGTGTGKSSLVNALVGQEVSKSGRERPTTRRPTLIAQTKTELDPLDLPLSEFDIVRVDSPVLRDTVLIDCPDPDTSEAETSGSNLEILRQMLPHCDVLIYTSTQQKYRNARIVDELDVASTGCRLVFVQTHADVDADVREDWRSQLGDRYDVPDMFFVDSVKALAEQQSGERPGGEFSRLQDLLTTRLASVERIRIRRANLLDLTEAALARCDEHLSRYDKPLDDLEAGLLSHQQKMSEDMSGQLRSQLESSRHLWEQRILTSVTSLWGVSPFSSLLRLYNGLGAIIASASLLRARSGAQMVLVGAMQGTKWLASRKKDREAEAGFEDAAGMELNENLVQEARLVLSGHLHDAALDPAIVEQTSLEEMRSEAARMQGRFLSRAKQRIDTVIEELAKRNSGPLARSWYEMLLLGYVGYVFYRAGKNFFYDSAIGGKELLTVDYYVSAGIFFLLWAVTLVICFCRRLRRGLDREIGKLAGELATQKLTGGPFPQLESTLQEVRVERNRLTQLKEMCSGLRDDFATTPGLGAPSQLNAERLDSGS